MNVSFYVHQIRVHQTKQRMIEAYDEYLLEESNHFVMFYSIIQSIVIVISFVSQTYFIKKLFESPAPKNFNIHA